MANAVASQQVLEQVLEDFSNVHIRDRTIHEHTPISNSLMTLPGEQRNCIYRHYFDSLVSQCEVDVWDNQWPTFHFQDYLALLVVNRQVHNEASSIFEQEYLPSITWHFAEPECLYQFAEMVKRTNLKNIDVRFFITGMTPKWCPVSGIDSTHTPLPWDIVHQQHVPGKLRDARPAIWREYAVPVEADEVIEGEGYVLTGRVKKHYTIRTATIPSPDRRLKFHRGTRRLNIDRWCNDAFEALEGNLADVDWSKYVVEEGARARQAMKDRNAEVDAAGGTLFDRALKDVEDATAKGVVLTPAFFREKYKDRRF